jgi:hypothetical protein
MGHIEGIFARLWRQRGDLRRRAVDARERLPDEFVLFHALIPRSLSRTFVGRGGAYEACADGF